jgi:transposase
MEDVIYVGIDVHKETLAITIAEEGRNGAVRFLGMIPNNPTDISKLEQIHHGRNRGGFPLS